MSIDPLAVATVPADEEWDETLDALAHAVTRDMADRGLLSQGSEDAARYHVRSFGRRLINPLLDQVRAEVQASQQEAAVLKRESAQLRAWVGTVRRTRRRDLRIAAVLATLWTLLVVALGALLHSGEGGGLQANDAAAAAQTTPAPAAPARPAEP